MCGLVMQYDNGERGWELPLPVYFEVDRLGKGEVSLVPHLIVNSAVYSLDSFDNHR